MRRRKFLPVRCRWLAALWAVLSFSVLAAPVAEVTNMSGVSMARNAAGVSRILAVGSQLDSGDLVATAASSYAQIKFTDGGQITLRPNTQLRIDSYVFEQDRPQSDSLVMSLLKGGLRTITGLVGKRKKDSYEMRTVTATIGVRGTGYGAQLCQGDCQDVLNNEGNIPPDGLHVDVFDGVISVTNQAGQLLLSAGQFGYAQSARTQPVEVPRNKGVSSDSIVVPAQTPSGVNAECVIQ